MTTSLNGWVYPAKKLVTKKVPGTKRELKLNALCAPLLLAVAADYNKTVRPIDVGPVDDWGYADRDGRATPGKKSNHANGTAMDLNASEEGAMNSNWGKKVWSNVKTAAAIAAIKRRYGSCVQNGGDWRAKDYMHWEIKPGVTPADVAALTKKLGIDANGVRKS